MTSINRTGYPRFHQNTQYRKQELVENYSLSKQEISFVKKRARNTRAQCLFLVAMNKPITRIQAGGVYHARF